MITNSSVTPKSLSKKIVNLLSKMDSVQNHLKNRGDDRLIDNFSEGLTELLDLSRKLHKALQTDEHTKSLKHKAKRLHEHINKAIEDNKLSQSTLTNALKIHNELLYGMDKEKTAFTLKASDKKVLDAFINKQTGDSNNLSSTGIKLNKDSFASYPVAVWRGFYLHVYSEAESNAYGAMLIRYLKKKVAPHWFIREYADKDKLPALTFTRQGDSGYKGQYDETIYAYIPGERKPVGYLSWSVYNNKYSVKMVNVTPEYQRTGIASALYKEMCRDNKITMRDIQPSLRTDDGAALRRAIGSSKKTAKGLADLKGLDKLMGRLIGKGLYRLYVEKKKAGHFESPYLFYQHMRRGDVHDILESLTNSGIPVNHSSKYYLHLSDFAAKNKTPQIADNEESNQWLMQCAIDLKIVYVPEEMPTPGSDSVDYSGTLGAFLRGHTPLISLELGKILYREYDQNFGGPSEADYIKSVTNILRHELLHLVDASYSKVDSKHPYHNMRPLPKDKDDADRQYYNRDTEIKSYAGDIANHIWDRVSPDSARDLHEILNLSRDQFFRYMSHREIKRILTFIAPENRKVFFQRILTTLQRLAKKALQDLTKKNEDRYGDTFDPPKYKFRKYVDKWASKTKQAFEYDSEDMRDAFEHLNQQVEDDYDEDGGEFLSEENTEITYNASMPVSKILEHADYRSWGEFGPKSLVGLNKQEFLDEVSGYRGVSWAERAWEWVEQGSPDNPVILYVGDRTSTQVADGQGRVNIAVGMGWKTLPTVIIDDKGVTKQAAGFIPVERVAQMIAYYTININASHIKNYMLKLAEQTTPSDRLHTLKMLAKLIEVEVRKDINISDWGSDLPAFANNPILKTPKADALFKRITIDLNPKGKSRPSVLGSFVRPSILDVLSWDDEDDFDDDKPSIPEGGAVQVYWFNLLLKVYNKTGWLDPKDVEKELVAVLSHELHHAADWAYQQAAKPGLFDKRNPAQNFDDPGKLDQDGGKAEYYNSPTELKSFALNVSQEVWQDLSNGGLSLKLLAGLQNLSYAEFTASINKDTSLFSRIKKFIRPENMRVFYKRVWGYLQKEISRQIEIYKRIERRGF